MRNSLLIGLAVISTAAIFSCKSNYICPSFESTYILDQPTRHKMFSLFDEDTLPREDFEVTKNKYGVIQSIKYKKKRDEMLTVKMETIFPQVEPLDTLLLAEQDLSPEEIEQLLNEGERPINHYNVDQIYYMRHFGQYLPMPEEPSAGQPDEMEVEEEFLEEPQQKKKKKWQFWKKDVEEVDSLNIGFEQETAEPEEQDLSKKELRQIEQREKAEQEELERAREPKVIDLEDFEKDRGISTQPIDEKPSRKRKVKDNSKKEKKKIRLGFGKKKKADAVELEE